MSEPLEKPRCSFFPQGLAQRCENEAVFALISPSEASFWYYPVCADCLPEASELNPNHFLAHLYGYGDEEHS